LNVTEADTQVEKWASRSVVGELCQSPYDLNQKYLNTFDVV